MISIPRIHPIGSSHGARRRSRELDGNGLSLEVETASFNYREGGVLSSVDESRWKLSGVVEKIARFLGVFEDEEVLLFRINEALYRKREAEFHDDHLIFGLVQRREHHLVKEALLANPSHLRITDAVGASIAHHAYRNEDYELGHFLVENFPSLAVLPISSQSTISNLKPEHMPYTGENILHIAIVHRKAKEVRWLLDFFNYRKHLLIEDPTQTRPLNGLQYLLRARATGRFFSSDSEFYMGETPLHFAACCNDTSLFDLVLNYSSIETPDALFSRDSLGNTILHLCVIRGHQRMLSHVVKTVKDFIAKTIRNAATEQQILIQRNVGVTRSQPFPIIFYEHVDIPSSPEKSGENAKAGESVRGHKPRPTLVKLPKGRTPESLAKWVRELSEVKFAELMSEVLNNDGHSLLTLAAHEKKADMLEFLISELKIPVQQFGPQNWHHIDLDGFERPHDRNDYNPPVDDKIEMYSAIDWLCIVNGQAKGDSVEPPVGFKIPAVRQIIEIKWDRIGRPKFMQRFYLSLANLVLITIISAVPDLLPTIIPVRMSAAPTGAPTGLPTSRPTAATLLPSLSAAPTSQPTFASSLAGSLFMLPPIEDSISILYILTAVSLLAVLVPEVPYMHKYRLMRGAARIEKIWTMTTFLAFCSMCICKLVYYYELQSVYIHDDQYPYPRLDNRS